LVFIVIDFIRCCFLVPFLQTKLAVLQTTVAVTQKKPQNIAFYFFCV